MLLNSGAEKMAGAKYAEVLSIDFGKFNSVERLSNAFDDKVGSPSAWLSAGFLLLLSSLIASQTFAF